MGVPTTMSNVSQERALGRRGSWEEPSRGGYCSAGAACVRGTYPLGEASRQPCQVQVL